MKTALILLCMSQVVMADQAADSFGTGFADALRRQIEAQQYGYQQQQSMEAQRQREEELELLREQNQLMKEQLELQERSRREQRYGY